MVPLSCINGASRPKARWTKWQRTIMEPQCTILCIVHCQYFAPCKGIKDSSGFRIPRCGFRIPDSNYRIPDLSLAELGFRIPIVSGIPDFYICIPDSKAQDSGFHQQKFPRFRIPHGKISRIKELGFPYMWRNFVLQKLSSNAKELLVVQ